MIVFRRFTLTLILLIASRLVAPAQASYSGLLAGWAFHSLTGGRNNFGASPLAATTNEANVTVTGLTRGSGVGAAGTAAARAWGGYQFNSPSAADAVISNQFITFAVTAKTGFEISFTSITPFAYRCDPTGPTNGVIQYSVGGGSFTNISSLTYTNFSTNGFALGPVDLTGTPALQNVPTGTKVTFRIVNWGAPSSLGIWYFYDVNNSTQLDFAIQGTVINNAFQIAYDAGPGFFGGENLIVTNASGILLGAWSSAYGSLAVSNWFFEGTLQEQPLGNSLSRYSINLNPETSPMYYVIAATNVCNYTPTEAVTTITTPDYVNFDVVSTNETITAGGEFAIATPVVILESPEDTNVFAGVTASLGVGATGSGTVSYQWFKNSTPLTNSDYIFGAQSSTVTFAPARTRQSGSYSVVVTNLLGSATSGPALFNVVPVPPLTAVSSTNGLMLSAANGAVNATYVIQGTANLTPPVVWVPLQTNVIGTAGTLGFTATNAASGAGFYRVLFP